ncbi:MAG: GGDEF domain-containing protein, partial [Dehalococcoidia bacterium]
FGGDEFLVLAPALPVPAAAEGVARRILQALAEPFPHEGRLLKVAASAGVALFPQHAQDPEALIRIADGAIHLAKDEGGDTFRFGTSEESGSARDRLSLEADLREAVEQHAFEIYYQPQVDPITQELRGVEALLRWRHAERGSVSPVDFIPLLEETGLIVPVGEWVLEQSCTQMQAWIMSGMTPVRMAVNLSPRQLMVPGLGRVVRSILERTGLQPELLELELTETTASLTMDAVIEVLHELHAIGITTAIDDFGIGHSWLGRLRQFPVQTLKVDRSFVHGMDQSAGDRAIVEAVVALGHALGLTVVAEGVESERDLDLVRQVGCDLVQGYYYSPAVDATTMTAMMREETASRAAA